jgi:hypothetical protein
LTKYGLGNILGDFFLQKLRIESAVLYHSPLHPGLPDNDKGVKNSDENNSAAHLLIKSIYHVTTVLRQSVAATSVAATSVAARSVAFINPAIRRRHIRRHTQSVAAGSVAPPIRRP